MYTFWLHLYFILYFFGSQIIGLQPGSLFLQFSTFLQISFALTSNPLFSLNFKNPLLHDKPIGATPNNLQPLL